MDLTSTAVALTEKRHAFNQAIAANDGLLRSLADRIIANPDRPLHQGEWTVRDAMCHVAARANSVTMALGIVKRTIDVTDASASFDIDTVNRNQILERADASTRDLIGEALAGHAKAMTDLVHLDDATLEQTISLPQFDHEIAFIDLAIMAGPGHDEAHLSEIEAALTN